jgi:hypothetical protein
MDPYLEHPSVWPDLHNRLIARLGDTLGPVLRPRYYVRLEERTYAVEGEGLLFAGRPDVTVADKGTSREASTREPTSAAAIMEVEVPMPDEVRETYLVVRAAPTHEVVTVLEILSPANKRAGPGRELYTKKRLAVLGSRTHLVEIDLLRAGDPMTVFGAPAERDYRILISRAENRPRARLLAFSLRDPIPAFSLPLRAGDPEPVVHLAACLAHVYANAGYDLTVDYSSAAAPPLRPEDAAWARALTRSGGERN